MVWCSRVADVYAAVPDARDKGCSCDFQSPLCQRHVTDKAHLYMLHALAREALNLVLFVVTLLRSCTKLATRVWPCAGLPFGNKQLLHKLRSLQLPANYPTASSPPLGQDIGIQQTYVHYTLVCFQTISHSLRRYRLTQRNSVVSVITYAVNRAG